MNNDYLAAGVAAFSAAGSAAFAAPLPLLPMAACISLHLPFGTFFHSLPFFGDSVALFSFGGVASHLCVR